MGAIRYPMSEIDPNPPKTLGFDPEKCSKLLEQLVDAFTEVKPTVGEILVIYGNLGYTLGASIEGHKGSGPNIKEVKKRYYSEPSVGNALMVQGIEITNWFQDHQEETIKNTEK